MGYYPEALTVYTDWLNRAPVNVVLHILRGMVLLNGEQTPEAFPSFSTTLRLAERALQDNPQDTHMQVVRGDALWMLAMEDEAHRETRDQEARAWRAKYEPLKEHYLRQFHEQYPSG